MKIHSGFSKLKLYTYIDFVLKIYYAYVSNLKAIFSDKYIFWSILHIIQKFNKPINTPARLDQLVERDQEYIKHVSLTRRVGK